MKILDKDALRQLMGANQLDHIFSSLFNWLNIIGTDEFRDELVLHLSDYNEILKQERLGTLTADSARQRKTDLKQRLLAFINQLPEEADDSNVLETVIREKAISAMEINTRATEETAKEVGPSKSESRVTNFSDQQAMANQERSTSSRSFSNYRLIAVLLLALGLLAAVLLNKFGVQPFHAPIGQSAYDEVLDESDHLMIVLEGLEKDLSQLKNKMNKDSLALKTLIMDTHYGKGKKRLKYLNGKIQAPLFKKIGVSEWNKIPDFETDERKLKYLDLYIFHWHTYQEERGNAAASKSEDDLVDLLRSIQKAQDTLPDHEKAQFFIYSQSFSNKAGRDHFKQKTRALPDTTNLIPLPFHYELYEREAVLDTILQRAHKRLFGNMERLKAN